MAYSDSSELPTASDGSETSSPDTAERIARGRRVISWIVSELMNENQNSNLPEIIEIPSDTEEDEANDQEAEHSSQKTENSSREKEANSEARTEEGEPAETAEKEETQAEMQLKIKKRKRGEAEPPSSSGRKGGKEIIKKQNSQQEKEGICRLALSGIHRAVGARTRNSKKLAVMTGSGPNVAVNVSESALDNQKKRGNEEAVALVRSVDRRVDSNRLALGGHERLHIKGDGEADKLLKESMAAGLNDGFRKKIPFRRRGMSGAGPNYADQGHAVQLNPGSGFEGRMGQQHGLHSKEDGEAEKLLKESMAAGLNDGLRKKMPFRRRGMSRAGPNHADHGLADLLNPVSGFEGTGQHQHGGGPNHADHGLADLLNPVSGFEGAGVHQHGGGPSRARATSDHGTVPERAWLTSNTSANNACTGKAGLGPEEEVSGVEALVGLIFKSLGLDNGVEDRRQDGEVGLGSSNGKKKAA